MENQDQYISTWSQCLGEIQRSVSSDEFSRWFAPLEVLDFKAGVLRLGVPDKNHQEYIEQNYIPLLRPIIRNLFGIKARLQYAIPAPQPVVVSATSPSYTSSNGTQNATIKNPFVIPGLRRVQFDSQLLPSLTFASHVEGACNRLARSAGKAISLSPGTTDFNPLFVYGNSGLGKTHIVQAIGNAIKERDPESRVLYVSCNHFQSQFQNAAMRKELSDFINFYQQIDVLIVDDIQEIAGKSGTQNIFFNIFNHLKMIGKQVILTSDRPVVELENIDDRLITRFKWGLAAELTPPDYDTKIAILRSKARAMNLKVGPEIIEFLAENIKANVRELEGALTSLDAHSRLLGRKITLELTRDVMRDIVRFTLSEVTIDSIVELVCSTMAISHDELISPKRTREVATARQVAMYLCKAHTKAALSSIGAALGKRTHATVMHACNTVPNLMETDKILRKQVEDIERKLQY
ncbi:MAG: chromosomal replication initiator protein DnaA [Mucinivorans sp.]